jgi:hypothetical protein
MSMQIDVRNVIPDTLMFNSGDLTLNFGMHARWMTVLAQL